MKVSRRQFARNASAARRFGVVAGVLMSLLVAFSASASTEPERKAEDTQEGMPASFTFDLETSATMHPEVRLLPRRQLVAVSSAALEDGARIAQAEGAPAPEAPVDVAEPEAAAPPSFDPGELPKARGVYEEGRVYWYAAGASALASLGVRVIGFFPGLFASALVLSGGLFAIGPAASMAVLVAVGLLFAVLDASAAALASSLVFDQMSNFYKSRFLSAFGGQLLGSALATGITGLMFGYGSMLISGTTSLGAFVASEVPSFIAVFSFFGLLPAIPIAFFASVAIPALIGAWATAAGAEPNEGLVIDPAWNPRGDEWSKLLPSLPADRNARVLPLAIRFGH